MTYAREFTVASSNTWEFFQVTFPGNTASAFDNDANASLEIGIVLASDSAQVSAVNQWEAGGDTGGSPNQVNGLSSTSNNIYTTGWQFEVGSIATDFEHENYQTTLAKCYRYYQRWNITTAFGYIASGHNAGTTVSRYILPTRVTMRAAPTLEVSAVADFQVQDATGSKDTTNVTLMTSFPEVVTIAATPASSQTVSLATMFGADNSTSRWFALLAEI